MHGRQKRGWGTRPPQFGGDVPQIRSVPRLDSSICSTVLESSQMITGWSAEATSESESAARSEMSSAGLVLEHRAPAGVCVWENGQHSVSARQHLALHLTVHQSDPQSLLRQWEIDEGVINQRAADFLRGRPAAALVYGPFHGDPSSWICPGAAWSRAQIRLHRGVAHSKGAQHPAQQLPPSGDAGEEGARWRRRHLPERVTNRQCEGSGEHLRGQDDASGASGRQPGLRHERAARGRGGAAGHGVGRRTQLAVDELHMRRWGDREPAWRRCARPPGWKRWSPVAGFERWAALVGRVSRWVSAASRHSISRAPDPPITNWAERT